MNFCPLKALLLGLLLATTSFLTAQEGEACDLSGPETLIVTLTPPDVIDVGWSPVAGAMAYEVLLVDLDNNQILYNNTVFGTFVSIIGITPPPNSVVSVAPICDNGGVGGATTESVYHIRIDDLIVQRPGGGTTTYTCPGNESYILEIDWTTLPSTGFGTVNIPITPNYSFTGRPKTKTFLHLESIQPFATPSVSSIAEVFHDATVGGNQALFPSQVTLGTNPSINSNTDKPRLINANPSQLKVTYTQTSPGNSVFIHDFYEINLDPSTLGSVEFRIPADFENMEISSTNCIEGTPVSGSLGFQSSGNNNQDEVINQRNTFTSAITTISPNPVSDRLTVEPNQPGQVTIMDLNGRIWHQEATDGRALNVSVSHWPAGSYILRHQGDGTPHIQRFIKL